jgi:Fe-S-cluster-containing dehydrogenase component
VRDGLAPACASGCPTRALEFLEFDEIVSAKISETAARETAALAGVDAGGSRGRSPLELILTMRKEMSRG